MCIISAEINDVSDTNIFVAPNHDYTRQLVIYSNKIDNIANNNTMILPVPYPESVDFIDMSDYGHFFEDCNNCFKNTNVILSNCYRDSYNLRVFDVGSYRVSLANNMNDLKRINREVFNIDDDVLDVLKSFYKKNFWGFIICKLKPGNEKYHPFAYSHKMVQDRISCKIFIPTRHYHKTLNNVSYDNVADDWSHSIYLFNINEDEKIENVNSCNMTWIKRKIPNINKIRFDFGRCLTFNKIEIKGKHPNTDIVIPV